MLRRIARERSGLTDAHRQVLETGWSHIPKLAPSFFHPDGTTDGEAVRDAWAELGDTIMGECNTPGKRPAAWWWFESPEPRDPDKSEAAQLFELGELSDAEMKELAIEAGRKNAQLHANSWHAAWPFRRSWLYWRFVAGEPRDTTTTEYEQLKKLDQLTTHERAIRANPVGAMNGQVGSRTRFFYLSRREMSLLGLQV